jgi:hypothetical protein
MAELARPHRGFSNRLLFHGMDDWKAGQEEIFHG